MRDLFPNAAAMLSLQAFTTHWPGQPDRAPRRAAFLAEADPRDAASVRCAVIRALQ